MKSKGCLNVINLTWSPMCAVCVKPFQIQVQKWLEYSRFTLCSMQLIVENHTGWVIKKDKAVNWKIETNLYR